MSACIGMVSTMTNPPNLATICSIGHFTHAVPPVRRNVAYAISMVPIPSVGLEFCAENVSENQLILLSFPALNSAPDHQSIVLVGRAEGNSQ